MPRNDSNFDSDFNAGSQYDSNGSDRFSKLGQTATQQIDGSPLVAVGAGIALGALLGAVLPTSPKERELLGPLGTRLNDAGTGAIDRSREMAKQKFDEVAGDSVRSFFGAGPDNK